MHHVIIILTVTFIQGPTDINHEMFYYFRNLFQTMPIKFTVKIIRLKVYIIYSQSDETDLNWRSQLRLKLYSLFFGTIIVISWTFLSIQTWDDGRFIMYGIKNIGYNLCARFDNLTLLQDYSG